MSSKSREEMFCCSGAVQDRPILIAAELGLEE